MKFVFYSVVAILAVIAGVVSFRLSDNAVNPKPVVQTITGELVVKTVDILVAKTDIPVGSIVDMSMVDRQPWPENLVASNFIRGDDAEQNIIGKIVRSTISANEPFVISKLANPNDPGFLAAGLPVGMRAVTVATDNVAGIAGFVFPGDRVDLLFTHVGDAKAGGRPDITEVLASNVRVLAINTRSTAPAASIPTSPNSMTLEVSDAMAQKIRLAEKNGTLSFSLRSIHDRDSIAPIPSILSDLSNGDSSDRAIVALVRGPGKITGGKIIAQFVKAVPSGDDEGEAKGVSGVAKEISHDGH